MASSGEERSGGRKDGLDTVDDLAAWLFTDLGLASAHSHDSDADSKPAPEAPSSSEKRKPGTEEADTEPAPEAPSSSDSKEDSEPAPEAPSSSSSKSEKRRPGTKVGEHFWRAGPQSSPSSIVERRHPDRKVCKYFLKFGNCKNTGCMYDHPPESRPQSSSSSSIEKRQPGQKVCKFSKRDGNCQYPACTYYHPAATPLLVSPIKLDLINELPDEVITFIISLLPTMEEAAITTAVSRRWRTLWTSVPLLRQQLNLSFPFLFLTKARVSGIQVDDLQIEETLSGFPVLREFILVGPCMVRNLTLQCSLLQKLKITDCLLLKRLSLQTPELQSFRFGGPDITFDFGHLPSLDSVAFDEQYCRKVVLTKFNQFSPLLQQFRKISFFLDSAYVFRFPRVADLSGIRKVELHLRVQSAENPTLQFRSLLLAFPNAQKLFLSLVWSVSHRVIDMGGELGEETGVASNVTEFELEGYIGNGLEVDFCKILLSRAILLKTVMIRISRRPFLESDIDLMGTEERIFAINHAEDNLQHILQLRGIKFVVLQ